jgi:hypothetical protein
MRGRLLAFDFRTGTGEISGEDGERYIFSDSEWQTGGRPLLGQSVDFRSDSGRARSIYGLAAPSAVSGDKSKVVAALLAFLFGVFGVHKFYLGRTGAGLTMLLVSVLLGILILPLITMSIIAFVECIIYLVSSDEEFEKRYAPGGKSWF